MFKIAFVVVFNRKSNFRTFYYVILFMLDFNIFAYRDFGGETVNHKIFAISLTRKCNFSFNCHFRSVHFSVCCIYLLLTAFLQFQI